MSVLEYPDVPEPLSGFPYSNVVVSSDLMRSLAKRPLTTQNT
jgi:hypothetical protein